MIENITNEAAVVSSDLRKTCAEIRRKPYPISDIIPQLQDAANTIDLLTKYVTELQQIKK